MSLVIIDGHNAAFGLRLRGRGEAGRRQALLELLQRSRLASSDIIWVVFDSRRGEDHHGYWLDRETYSLRVLFAAGSFDDWVVQQAESGELETDTVVVTNDWDLRLRLSGRVICRGLDDYFHRRRR